MLPAPGAFELASLLPQALKFLNVRPDGEIGIEHIQTVAKGNNLGAFDITHVGSLFTEGEAADICSPQRATFTGTGGTTLAVSAYWSNADNACVALDNTPPTTSAALSPAPNADGWNNGDVTVALTAVDSGSPSTGVKEIHFSATGAQPIASTTVAGDGAAGPAAGPTNTGSALKSAPHLFSPNGAPITPRDVPSDGLAPATFFTYQIVFVPDMPGYSTCSMMTKPASASGRVGGRIRLQFAAG